ncbi:MAG: hypothetical protein IBJ18_12925, partial [Phycisphaerales bacterium]|nr:hypothetical protein [Phycisphaerales bacterium]
VGGVGGGDLLSRSLFVDAEEAGVRLWSADLAARSSSVLVVADGSGFDMAATRRLQLAAECGGWMVHLARPPWEVRVLSAAATRWRVRRAASAVGKVRQCVGVLRCKGLRSMVAMDRTFALQRESRDRFVCVSAEAGERPGEAEVAG